MIKLNFYTNLKYKDDTNPYEKSNVYLNFCSKTDSECVVPTGDVRHKKYYIPFVITPNKPPNLPDREMNTNSNDMEELYLAGSVEIEKKDEFLKKTFFII